jgi:plastocyanin
LESGKWFSVRRAMTAALTLLVLNGQSALAIGDVAPPVADPVSVNILDAPRPQPKWGYAPATRTVDVGTWVTWSNDGEDAHTVTAVDGSFDSGNLDPSEGFSWFFDQAGTFTYLCSLHPWMTGKIVVGDGVSAAPPPDASSGSQP